MQRVEFVVPDFLVIAQAVAVGIGGDDTLFAKADGVVKFGSRKGRKLVDVLPN